MHILDIVQQPCDNYIMWMNVTPVKTVFRCGDNILRLTISSTTARDGAERIWPGSTQPHPRADFATKNCSELDLGMPAERSRKPLDDEILVD